MEVLFPVLEKVKGSVQNDSSSSSLQFKPAAMQYRSDAAAEMQQKSLDTRPLAAREAIVLQQMVGNRQMGKVLQAMYNDSAVDSNSTSPSHNQPSGASGLPDQLKTGIEALSGISLDDVNVHYNSGKPKQLDALAYARGNEIHLGPGQEQHLPHEAWHVVQQRQGRVKPTMQLKGVAVNDNDRLEKEATEFGSRAMNVSTGSVVQAPLAADLAPLSVAQLMLIKVRTEKGEAGRRISLVEFEGRVPTSAKHGQGDHTVADYLPKLTLQEYLYGKTHREAAASLRELFELIDDKTKTKFLNDDSKMIELTKNSVIKQLAIYQEMVEQPSTEGEDLNTALESLLDGYLRLWNKRTGAAYNRLEDKTTGGGGGVTEKEAKKQLILLGSRARDNVGDEDAALETVPSLIDSIDFKATSSTLEEASSHINMALELILRAYPELEYNGSDVMYALVNAYAQKMNLDEVQAEEMLRHCYESYFGDSYDMDMD